MIDDQKQHRHLRQRMLRTSVAISATVAAAVSLFGCVDGHRDYVWTIPGAHSEPPWWETVHPDPTSTVPSTTLSTTTTASSSSVVTSTSTTTSTTSSTIADASPSGATITTRYTVLTDVLFATDKSTISTAGQALITDFVKTTITAPGITVISITVSGNTDCRGNRNDQLSGDRAWAGIDALIEAGVNPEVIGPPVANGCRVPAVHPSGTTQAENDRLDRRIELAVTARVS